MKFKSALCGAAASIALSSVPAGAATIHLIDNGGVTGSQAEWGFKVAAAYWGSVLTNNVTIDLGVKFAALAPNVIGSTGSARNDFSVQNWENAVNATKSNSTLDQTVVLPTLNNGGISTITQGVDSTGNNDTRVQVYDNGSNAASKTLYLNTSVTKAIGGTASYLSSNAGHHDGDVTFSSNFSFDFDPSDGITAGKMDFIGVAIHEIGHALGFVSGVDFFDAYGQPNGPGKGSLGYDLNDTTIFSALDMFRYSLDPNGVAPGVGPSLDETVGGTPYFSIDGGLTQLFGDSRFSTGAYNGDGNQASHWKDASGVNSCGPQVGIMDPTFCYAQMGEVTSLDLAAFDAMGWNISFDVLGNPTYRKNTSQIYADYAASVPEPATWAMMISGFGFIGGSLRAGRRSRKTAVAAA